MFFDSNFQIYLQILLRYIMTDNNKLLLKIMMKRLLVKPYYFPAFRAHCPIKVAFLLPHQGLKTSDCKPLY